MRVLTVSVIALFFLSATAQADLFVADEKAQKLKVNLQTQEAKISTKTKCGKAQGKFTLTRKGEVWRAFKKTSKKSVRLKVEEVRDAVSIKVTVRAKKCAASKTLVAHRVGEVSSDELGHYTGSTSQGHTISFDVVGSTKEASISNLTVDVDLECERESDLEEVFMRATLTSSGELFDDGFMEVYFSDESNPEYPSEWFVEGVLKEGSAQGEVYVDAVFDAQGDLNPQADHYCVEAGEEILTFQAQKS